MYTYVYTYTCTCIMCGTNFVHVVAYMYSIYYVWECFIHSCLVIDDHNPFYC